MKATERIEEILSSIERFIPEDDHEQRDELRAELDEIRTHLVLSAHLLTNDLDDETTQFTTDAKRAGLKAIGYRRTHTGLFVDLGDETILLEVVGQTPDLIRYRQGMNPARLGFLNRIEEAGIPVLLAFYHGGWELAWLSTLPDPEAIVLSHNGDSSSGRFGWYAGENETAKYDPVLWVRDELDLDDLPPREPPFQQPFAQDKIW